jgi:hypothetical protein
MEFHMYYVCSPLLHFSIIYAKEAKSSQSDFLVAVCLFASVETTTQNYLL